MAKSKLTPLEQTIHNAFVYCGAKAMESKRKLIAGIEELERRGQHDLAQQLREECAEVLEE